MMRALYAGVSGLQTHQTKMDVIGNNIANVNTIAFKSSSTTFSELMYQTLTGASGPTNGRGGTNAKQIGLGVTSGSTSVNITSPGASQTTGQAFDLKISGDSFFVVNNGNTNFFTKAGAFTIDTAGNLVMKSTGYNVMGWQVDPTTGTVRKDTVSALRIMQEKNLTSNPEATTKATCAGILDKNSSDVNTENGQGMSLTFYDSLGYAYSAKFAIKGDANSKNNGTYSIELADIIDSQGNSVVKEYLAKDPGNTLGDLFGNQNVVNKAYAINTTAGFATNGTTYTYTDPNVEGATPQPLTYDATKKCFTYNDAGGRAVEVAVTKVFTGLPESVVNSTDPAFDLSNVRLNATTGAYEYNHTADVFSYELDFNENSGLFDHINTAGNSTVNLKLSALGGNFSNVEIDFSQTKSVQNGGTSTIGMEKGGGPEGTDGTGKKLGDLINLSVANDGTIWGSYDNGNTVLLGQIASATFANPAGLEKTGDNCYQTTLNSGEFDGIGQDITADGGSMLSGVLEMSNVDLSSEFTEMITTQRGFQANSRIITTSDSLLEELINLKR